MQNTAKDAELNGKLRNRSNKDVQLTDKSNSTATAASRSKSRSKRSRSTLGRGRPTAGSRVVISAAIMEAATEVFLASGFEKASMEAIAARAGITRVTLYKRFPDKRSLLRAVVQDYRQHWIWSPPTASGVEARLKHYASTILVKSISAEMRAINALATSAWPAPHDLREREEAVGYNELVRLLEGEIRQGGGEFGASTNASMVAAALMAMISGWFDRRVPDPNRDAIDAEEFAGKAVDLLIHGRAAW